MAAGSSLDRYGTGLAAAILLQLGTSAPTQVPALGRPPPVNRGFQPDTGPLPDFATLKPVPHGETRIVWYASKVLGEQRRLHVWLPPGHAEDRTAYPVLYPIHGGNQNDSAWTEASAPYIFDNLLAAGAMRPMIVVMPNGAVAGGGPSGDVSTPAALAARTVLGKAARAKFVDSLLADTIPFVEASYRVRSDRESRAVAGFSLGGEAGPRSIAESGISAAPAAFVTANPRFFGNSDRTNRDLKLLWIASGVDDGVVANAPGQLHQTLAAHGIRHSSS